MLLIPVRVCGFLLGLDVDHAWGRFPVPVGVVVRFLNIVFMFFAESLILAQDERWRRA